MKNKAMKKQKSHKASKWDDYDPNEFAEQILEDMQEHARISQDLKRVLAKTKTAGVDRLRKELDEHVFDRGELRKQKYH